MSGRKLGAAAGSTASEHAAKAKSLAPFLEYALKLLSPCITSKNTTAILMVIHPLPAHLETLLAPLGDPLTLPQDHLEFNACLHTSYSQKKLALEDALKFNQSLEKSGILKTLFSLLGLIAQALKDPELNRIHTPLQQIFDLLIPYLILGTFNPILIQKFQDQTPDSPSGLLALRQARSLEILTYGFDENTLALREKIIESEILPEHIKIPTLQDLLLGLVQSRNWAGISKIIQTLKPSINSETLLSLIQKIALEPDYENFSERLGLLAYLEQNFPALFSASIDNAKATLPADSEDLTNVIELQKRVRIVNNLHTLLIDHHGHTLFSSMIKSRTGVIESWLHDISVNLKINLGLADRDISAQISLIMQALDAMDNQEGRTIETDDSDRVNLLRQLFKTLFTNPADKDKPFGKIPEDKNLATHIKYVLEILGSVKFVIDGLDKAKGFQPTLQTALEKDLLSTWDTETEYFNEEAFDEIAGPYLAHHPETQALRLSDEELTLGDSEEGYSQSLINNTTYFAVQFYNQDWRQESEALRLKKKFKQFLALIDTSNTHPKDLRVLACSHMAQLLSEPESGIANTAALHVLLDIVNTLPKTQTISIESTESTESTELKTPLASVLLNLKDTPRSEYIQSRNSKSRQPIPSIAGLLGQKEAPSYALLMNIDSFPTASANTLTVSGLAIEATKEKLLSYLSRVILNTPTAASTTPMETFVPIQAPKVLPRPDSYREVIKTPHSLPSQATMESLEKALEPWVLPQGSIPGSTKPSEITHYDYPSKILDQLQAKIRATKIPGDLIELAFAHNIHEAIPLFARLLTRKVLDLQLYLDSALSYFNALVTPWALEKLSFGLEILELSFDQSLSEEEKKIAIVKFLQIQIDLENFHLIYLILVLKPEWKDLGLDLAYQSDYSTYLQRRVLDSLSVWTVADLNPHTQDCLMILNLLNSTPSVSTAAVSLQTLQLQEFQKTLARLLAKDLEEISNAFPDLPAGLLTHKRHEKYEQLQADLLDSISLEDALLVIIKDLSDPSFKINGSRYTALLNLLDLSHLLNQDPALRPSIPTLHTLFSTARRILISQQALNLIPAKPARRLDVSLAGAGTGSSFSTTAMTSMPTSAGSTVAVARAPGVSSSEEIKYLVDSNLDRQALPLEILDALIQQAVTDPNPERDRKTFLKLSNRGHLTILDQAADPKVFHQKSRLLALIYVLLKNAKQFNTPATTARATATAAPTENLLDNLSPYYKILLKNFHPSCVVFFNAGRKLPEPFFEIIDGLPTGSSHKNTEKLVKAVQSARQIQFSHQLNYADEEVHRRSLVVQALGTSVQVSYEGDKRLEVMAPLWNSINPSTQVTIRNADEAVFYFLMASLIDPNRFLVCPVPPPQSATEIPDFPYRAMIQALEKQIKEKDLTPALTTNLITTWYELLNNHHPEKRLSAKDQKVFMDLRLSYYAQDLLNPDTHFCYAEARRIFLRHLVWQAMLSNNTPVFDLLFKLVNQHNASPYVPRVCLLHDFLSVIYSYQHPIPMMGQAVKDLSSRFISRIDTLLEQTPIPELIITYSKEAQRPEKFQHHVIANPEKTWRLPEPIFVSSNESHKKAASKQYQELTMLCDDIVRREDEPALDDLSKNMTALLKKASPEEGIYDGIYDIDYTFLFFRFLHSLGWRNEENHRNLWANFQITEENSGTAILEISLLKLARAVLIRAEENPEYLELFKNLIAHPKFTPALFIELMNLVSPPIARAETQVLPYMVEGASAGAGATVTGAAPIERQRPEGAPFVATVARAGALHHLDLKAYPRHSVYFYYELFIRTYADKFLVPPHELANLLLALEQREALINRDRHQQARTEACQELSALADANDTDVAENDIERLTASKYEKLSLASSQPTISRRKILESIKLSNTVLTHFFSLTHLSIANAPEAIQEQISSCLSLFIQLQEKNLLEQSLSQSLKTSFLNLLSLGDTIPESELLDRLEKLAKNHAVLIQTANQLALNSFKKPVFDLAFLLNLIPGIIKFSHESETTFSPEFHQKLVQILANSLTQEIQRLASISAEIDCLDDQEQYQELLDLLVFAPALPNLPSRVVVSDELKIAFCIRLKQAIPDNLKVPHQQRLENFVFALCAQLAEKGLEFFKEFFPVKNLSGTRHGDYNKLAKQLAEAKTVQKQLSILLNQGKNRGSQDHIAKVKPTGLRAKIFTRLMRRLGVDEALGIELSTREHAHSFDRHIAPVFQIALHLLHHPFAPEWGAHVPVLPLALSPLLDRPAHPPLMRERHIHFPTAMQESSRGFQEEAFEEVSLALQIPSYISDFATLQALMATLQRTYTSYMTWQERLEESEIHKFNLASPSEKNLQHLPWLSLLDRAESINVFFALCSLFDLGKIHNQKATKCLLEIPAALHRVLLQSQASQELWALLLSAQETKKIRSLPSIKTILSATPDAIVNFLTALLRSDSETITELAGLSAASDSRTNPSTQLLCYQLLNQFTALSPNAQMDILKSPNAPLFFQTLRKSSSLLPWVRKTAHSCLPTMLPMIDRLMILAIGQAPLDLETALASNLPMAGLINRALPSDENLARHFFYHMAQYLFDPAHANELRTQLLAMTTYKLLNSKSITLKEALITYFLSLQSFLWLLEKAVETSTHISKQRAKTLRHFVLSIQDALPTVLPRQGLEALLDNSSVPKPARSGHELSQLLELRQLFSALAWHAHAVLPREAPNAYLPVLERARAPVVEAPVEAPVEAVAGEDVNPGVTASPVSAAPVSTVPVSAPVSVPVSEPPAVIPTAAVNLLAATASAGSSDGSSTVSRAARTATLRWSVDGDVKEWDASKQPRSNSNPAGAGAPSRSSTVMRQGDATTTRPLSKAEQRAAKAREEIEKHLDSAL